MTTRQPEALRLAEILEGGYSLAWLYERGGYEVSAELRRQHALIAELESRLEAIGAGGVSGPLIGQPQAMPDLSQLTERGAKAWAGVDAQGLREGFTAADLLDLIEAYAEARHRQGHSSYNAKTAAALQAVKDALAAGQATAAAQSGAKLNYSVLYVYANQHGIDYNSLCVAVREASAQPAAQQVVAYAELPEKYYLAGGEVPTWDAKQMRAFADATHTLRASRGQASSQAGEYPALVCDYCGALTPDPWHSSGMLHGKMSKHIHSCDACAARGAAQAQAAKQQEQLI